MDERLEMMKAHVAEFESKPVNYEPEDPENCISNWFPKILAAGLPVPKTALVGPKKSALPDLHSFAMDDKPLADSCREFVALLGSAADEMGYPCFLRSGHTSAKHDWKDSCYVTRKDHLPRHVQAIIYYGECNGVPGWPWDVWAVREYLPIIPIAHCPRYSGMPVCREFRCFVRDDELLCWHPYWPDEALERGGADVHSSHAFGATDAEIAGITALARRAGKAVGGDWSVDILETRNGWYVTDMATAHTSYHWPTCERLPR